MPTLIEAFPLPSPVPVLSPRSQQTSYQTLHENQRMDCLRLRLVVLILQTALLGLLLSSQATLAFVSSPIFHTNIRRSPSHRLWCARRSARKRATSHFASNVTNGEEQQYGQLDKHTYWKLPRLYVGTRQHVQSDGSSATSVFTNGSIVNLSPEQTHYLTKVMRYLKKNKKQKDGRDDMLSEKDCIRVFDGRNGEWLARVSVSPQHQEDVNSIDIGKRTKRKREITSLMAECIVQLSLQTCQDDAPWVLFVPLKKQPRMKLMIEKCTELGVGRMIPVVSDRSAWMVSSNNDDLDVLYGGNSDEENVFEKLELQAIEAAEQCERLSIPIITNEVSLGVQDGEANDRVWSVESLIEEWCRGWEERDVTADKRRLLVCRERGNDGTEGKVLPVIQALHDNPRVAFLVGPEGGWSPEEEAMFDSTCTKYQGKDSPVQCISLGSSVLRAETAGMMAVGAWALVHDS